MTGGANRERVLSAIAEVLASDGERLAGDVDPEEVLRQLEGYGYAVVREGQVPTVEPFAHAAERLGGIAELLNEGQYVHPTPGGDARQAADLLDQYRQFACIVLDVDEEDVDAGPDL
jgi:hypothetical protein